MSATADRRFAVRTDSLTVIHWVGILASLVSAAVHLRLGVGFAPSPLGVGFLVAGAGFLAAIVLIVFDIRRRTVYALGLPFTLGQIVIWYYVNFVAGAKAFPADIGTLGAVDKVAQIVLLAILLVLLRQ